MFFDAHGDILTDVMEQNREGKDIWNIYHQERYNHGGVRAGIFVNFTNPDAENQEEEFQAIHRVSVPYFKEHSEINVIDKFSDWNREKFNLILGIEGLNAVKNVEELEELYQIGYRHLGLTWNEKNKFATGCTNSGGITELGAELIKRAQELQMIIDYAHLNEQSFYEVAKISKQPIFVSHANARTLCNHPRNLTDEQLKLVAQSNGVIGLAAMHFFINENKEEATIDDLINHVMYIGENFGFDHVGFGFDFCYYLGSHTSENKVEGLKHIDDIKQIPKLLSDRGLDQETIDKVCYENMYRVVKTILK